VRKQFLLDDEHGDSFNKNWGARVAVVRKQFLLNDEQGNSFNKN
jgi:hypothetical protein